MDISFYTAAVGAHQQQRRLDVHANNIANVNNYGFRARRPNFQTLMTGQVNGINETLMRGVGSRMESDEPDFSPTGLVGTDRALDYAISGRGFFALLNPTTGEYTYTREGSFSLSNVIETVEPEIPEDATPEEIENLQPETVTTWYLSDGRGRYVIGTDGRPITIENPSEEMTVGGDMLPIGIFDFINYNGMRSEGLSGFIPVEKNGQVTLGDGRLVNGYLELSNADYAYEISKVIESQRSFQYMLRMVQTSDEITTTVNGLR